MSRERLVAFGIFEQGLAGFRHEAHQLRLDPFEPRLQLRVHRLVPGGIDRIDFPQHVDALARQRVGAAIAVVLRNGEAIFLVLQLLEEFQAALARNPRSEEHTSELQSPMRISYAVFCLKKKKQHNTKINKLTSIIHK